MERWDMGIGAEVGLGVDLEEIGGIVLAWGKDQDGNKYNLGGSQGWFEQDKWGWMSLEVNKEEEQGSNWHVKTTPTLISPNISL